jgi:hypothetical protein
VSGRIEVSVRDHVVDAVARDISEPVKVDVQSSVESQTRLQLAVTVHLPQGSHVEQLFKADIAMGSQAVVSPLEPIRIVGNDGVTRVLERQKFGQPTPEEANTRNFLLGAYIGAILVPVLGIIMALYTAVSERRKAISRHAVGIAGAALLAAGGYYLIIHAITTSGQDRNVASDLRSLLNSNFIQYDSVGPCAHQSGNQYVCTVTRNGSDTTVYVTDDGKTIYEQGIAANSP